MNLFAADLACKAEVTLIQTHQRHAKKIRELLDQIDELRKPKPPTEIQEIERSLAYERATSIIETNCPNPEEEWFDTAKGDDAIAEILPDLLSYLEARKCLIRHPTRPALVMFIDEQEGEPLS